MDADQVCHYLDVSILLSFLEAESQSNDAIVTYMQSAFRKCTSTTPKQQYGRSCERVSVEARRFLNSLINNQKVEQSSDLTKIICDEFNKFSNDRLNKSEFVKSEVASFVKAGVPKIVEAVKAGSLLEGLLQECIERARKLKQKLRGKLAAICHEGEEAQIKLYEVPEYQVERVINDDEFTQAFEHIKGRKEEYVLAEAYHIREKVLRDNHLFLVTKNKWAFLDLTPKHEIQKHLKINPKHPEDILKYMKSRAEEARLNP